MAEDAEVCSVGVGNCENRMVEKSPLRSKNSNKTMGYLTSKARLAFTQLKKAFTKAPILQYFDPECHIQIKTDPSGYAISGVLSQLTSDNLGQLHLVAFYLQKKISAETWYKTHNGGFLAIVEAFKTWRHYLEGCKHKVLVLTDHNNFCCFMDMKSLSFCQVW